MLVVIILGALKVECGIEENIFTACNDCHKEHDEGVNQLVMQEKSKNYLSNKYVDWNIEKLIYKKY